MEFHQIMEQVRAGYTAEKEFHLSLNRYKENYSDFVLVCNINDAYESFASAFYSLFWLKTKLPVKVRTLDSFLCHILAVLLFQT